MKKKYFLASLVLCFMILVNLLPTTVSAQETSGNKPGQAVDGTKPTMMAPSSTTNIKADRTQNGAPVIDANGTVTITEITADGGSKVTVVSKPTIANATSDIEADMNNGAYATWLADFKNWTNSNPDFKSFLSNQEISYLENGQIESIYKVQKQIAYKQSFNK